MLNEPIDQTLIIADNDSMMRGILRSILSRPKRAVRLASDGDEAVRIAEEVQAALVLLDLRMPRMDGLTACRTIRTLPNYRDIPIVILTGVPSAPERQAATRAGAIFWTKPIAIDELRRGLSPLIAMGQASIARACEDSLALAYR